MRALSLFALICAVSSATLTPALCLAQRGHNADDIAAPADAAGELGCFYFDETLLFGGAKMTLPEAEATHQSTVTMVSQDSTFDKLIFVEVPIGQFYHHHYKGGLITIETWDGDRLRVTMTHPVVLASGAYIMARDVQPDMLLWGINGPVAVMATRQSPYEGEVWHIVPATGTEGLQIVVSQDLLSGALPVQKALVTEQDSKLQQGALSKL